ncbi:MAG: rhodanese-like domain-containing protein [Salinirussus sp.]
MKRRRVVRILGAGLLTGLAGCAASDGSSTPTATPTKTPTPAPPTTFEPTIVHAGDLEQPLPTNGDFPPDPEPADGFPPTFDDAPAAPSTNPGSYDTLSVNDEMVRLVPIDVAVAWYRRSEARFVDARGRSQYAHAHVYGAVNSPARVNSAGGPVPGWPSGDRVVTYCGCPHHLSSIRAAGLQKAGYETVYALDDGFLGTADAWAERGYPMAGSAFQTETTTRVAALELTGTVDPANAGEYVWAVAGEHMEAARIDRDGSYTLHLRVRGLQPDSPVRIYTPEGAQTRPLSSFHSV